MKKILVLIVFLMMLNSVALASPLTDFSKGKTAIDITLYPNSDFKSSESTTNEMEWADAQSYMQFGITTGLCNNIAFQYNYSKMKTEDWSKKGNFTAGYDGVKNQEFNILYKVGKSFTVFTGLNQSQSVVEFINNYNEFGKPRQFKGKTKNNWQFGVTGQTQIADKLTGFATVALSKDMSYWKAGLGYAINKNIDFNIVYSKSKYENLPLGSDLAAISKYPQTSEVKGLGYGLTYKF